MKKKIFSLSIWAIFGIALFAFFVIIKKLYTTPTIDNFSQIAARGMKNRTWQAMRDGTWNTTMRLQGIAQQLWISTGELQNQLDNGKTMTEIMGEYGTTRSWAIQQQKSSSWFSMSAKDILNADLSWTNTASDIAHP